ncbi:MAG: PilZ domain-containing protein [Thermodesulfobacteriota bacterium]
MQQTSVLEHRKHKRIDLKKTIILNPGNASLLVNIGKGGLLFKSLKGMVWPEKWMLDIITNDREWDIEKCPVELVWMKADDEFVGSTVMLEHVGVKFTDLDQSQKRKLNDLLSQH